MKKILFLFLLGTICQTAFSQNYLLADDNADKSFLATFISEQIENEKFNRNPVIVVNDMVLEEDALDQMTFHRSDIININVIARDNQEAVSVYGEQGINGVLLIETRPPDEKNTLAERNILYLIDDKPATRDDIGTLNPADIRSIEVIKDKLTMAEYTSGEYEGIVKINMKKGESASHQ